MKSIRERLSSLIKLKDWIAMFIALLALTASIWSGWTSRAHDRLSARPHVQIQDMFASTSPRLGLVVLNSGPGIGIVDEFQLYLDGKALKGDWLEQWKTFRKATGAEGWTSHGGFHKGDVLSANSPGLVEILLIIDENKYRRADIPPQKWADLGEKLKNIVNRLTVSIKYHSEYGETFEIKRQGLGPAQFSRVNWLGQLVHWKP